MDKKETPDGTGIIIPVLVPENVEEIIKNHKWFPSVSDNDINESEARDVDDLLSKYIIFDNEKSKESPHITEILHSYYNGFLPDLIDTLVNKYPEDKDLKKAREILKRLPTNFTKQGELFPLFRPQKSVELKKEFALNFGGLERIEEVYKHLLKEKLTSGLTLQQHIDKVRNWFNSLRGEDLGNWIKLFAYVKAVKDYSETAEEVINFRELSPGRYCFSIKQKNEFFSYFIRPDKKSGQFTTKAKTKFLKWLHDNQNTIEFPIILNNKVWNIPMRIYEYAENVSDKEILFVVDTNILESEFKEYVSINIEEIDAIEEAWETIAKNNPDFSKHRLNNFVDIPLKFLLTLKNIYSRKGDYKNADFFGNIQRLSGESLDVHLGELSERIKTHLMSRDRLRTGKPGGNLLGKVERLIYETSFKIAIERKWLLSLPNYEGGLYIFNINPGCFDRTHTARRLKSVKGPKTP